MAEDPGMQRVMLDLFEHVSVPLASRSPFQNAFVGGPVINSRDAATVEERLQSQMADIGILQRGRIFSVFSQDHLNEAMRVVRLLTRLESRDLKLAMAFLRDQINEELFVYAASLVTFHKPEMRTVRLPPIEEVLPEKFFPASIIATARNSVRRRGESQDPIIIIGSHFTGDDLDIEHRLSYWREDVSLNSHHWHWHLVYPVDWLPEMGGMQDRKGELFYYMHQQMVARYDSERLSHNLSRVETLNNWDSPIQEGYAPHLNKETSGTVYASRPGNMTMQDTPQVSLNRLTAWCQRIMDSIHRGFFLLPNGSRQSVDEFTGIDKFGNIIEANWLSLNPDYYGNFHNDGHNVISRIHDPDKRFREEIAVMGDVTTAMRDPVFYRWHKLIDLMFQEHKNTLQPYETQQLAWDNVSVQEVKVQEKGSQQSNNLHTFWQDSDIRLDRGLDFSSPTPITVRVRHLQHKAFTYELTIQNGSSSAQTGTVRIFLAPRLNESRETFDLDNQRHLFMELDKFEVQLNPGRNVISRNSIESSVTITNKKTFTQLIAEAESGSSEEQQNYCSCGLPDHLLIPRGKPGGMTFQLFVMVTNATEDRVNGGGGQACHDASSYCGLLNKLYPDKKPMGFPFDRRIKTKYLTEFKTGNMNFADVIIRFCDEVVDASGTTIFRPAS